MTFSADIAEKRFGYGLSPRHAPPGSVQDMLAGVSGPDAMQARFPLPPFHDLKEQIVLKRRFDQHARANRGTEQGKASARKSRDVRAALIRAHDGWFGQTLLRRVHTKTAFRERLVSFWADHFTAQGRRGLLRWAAPLYVEEALRPQVGGTFGDMLEAALTHPVMLHYLDQYASVGPNSIFAKRRGQGRGLNENLAREVLELHTLGVGGPYDQADVHGLAKLLTGLSFGRGFGFVYRKRFAEPGAHRVLGRSYDAAPSMDRVRQVIRDLARHPATARHIAHKLAVHFLSDTPPEALVSALSKTYLETDGALMPLYDTLLNHAAVWQEPPRNIRPPLEFISAGLRALAVPPKALQSLNRRQTGVLFFHPLRVMGQVWHRAEGPDGWPEEDNAWITPQGIAGRLEWAVDVPRRLLGTLPDPRAFVTQTLGAGAPGEVIFAASAAESRAEAIGLVLMSPAFQRR